MKQITFKLSLVLAAFIGAAAFVISFVGSGTEPSNDMAINTAGWYISFNDAIADSLPQVRDQMVCHAGKILPVLNQNYTTKSLTCMKQSLQKNQGYNNLADIFAEGWVIMNINNNNIWLFYK